MVHDLVAQTQEICNLIIIAIIYSVISLMSCCGIIFLIFFKYVRETYETAKATRESLRQEEIKLIKKCEAFSEEISRLTVSFSHDHLRSLRTSRRKVKITVIPDNTQD